MRMLAEYLENAIRFEQLAAAETDAKLKANLGKAGCRLPKACGKARQTGSTSNGRVVSTFLPFLKTRPLCKHAF